MDTDNHHGTLLCKLKRMTMETYYYNPIKQGIIYIIISTKHLFEKQDNKIGIVLFIRLHFTLFQCDCMPTIKRSK